MKVTMLTQTDILPIANDGATNTMRQHLLEALGRTNPREINIATAYLTPHGFMELQHRMEPAERVRLLLGERPFLNRRGPADTLANPEDVERLLGPAESVDWHTFLEGGYPWLLLTHDERRELLNRGYDPSASAFDLSAWDSVTALTTFLGKDGVEIRRFLGSEAGTVPHGEVLGHRSPRNRLHAKAYLFTGDKEVYSSVGSSNLTKSGLYENAELNLGSYDPALAASLDDWFHSKWERGQDCKEEFIRRLEDCVLLGLRYTPWQVMLKSLHAAYGRFLELGLSEEIMNRLAGFQQQAVQRCIALLKRHWGAMLCDSVGLGKTYEGMGILREFANQRTGESPNPAPTTRALIVSPAQLQDNWNATRLSDWGIFSETVTMESLPSFADIDTESTDVFQAMTRDKLRHFQQDFDIILVDESHNFRNPRTKRYRALMDIIRGGKPDKRVLLMTATPINNSIWDLYHQLMLITRGEDTWYAGRGPIPNIRTAFQTIEDGQGGTTLLDLMMLFLVRRTRHDIRAMQQAGEAMEINGQLLRFPDHQIPEPIQYSFTGLYGSIYQDIIDTIERLNFAVYRLEEYGVETDDNASTATVLQRNANFVGIMRTILLKRMESSLAALTSTVTSLVDYLNLFLTTLDQGDVLTPRQAYKLRAILGGSLPDQDQDIEDLEPNALAVLRDVLPAPTEQKKAALYTDAQYDRDRLTTLLRNLEWLEEMLSENGDPKALAVRQLLESLPERDANGLPTKVALFTTYKDTAEHLFQHFGGDASGLQGELRAQSNLTDKRWMSVLTGQDSQGRRRAVLERFAPLATHREAEPLDDDALTAKIESLRDQSIELLISTDVLSEGQNLQDAQFLINYDLPWNPVRIIQRAGRIDRLFSPHNTVFIYNVMPEDGLEDLLNLVGNLTAKIETIEDTVALDASVLGEQIQATQLDKVMKLRAGGADAEEVYREGERSQGLDEGSELLNKYLDLMREFATEDIREIPDGVYSVKQGAENGVYVMLKMPEDMSGEVFWRFYPIGNIAQPNTSPHSVLEIIDAHRDEERFALDRTLNPFRFLRDPLEAAVNQIGHAYMDAVASVSPDTLTTKISRLLQRDDLLEADPDLWQFFDRWVQLSLPTDTIRRLAMQDPVRTVNQINPGRANLDDVSQALNRLRSAIQAEGLDRGLVRPDTKQPSVADLELIAWELVVDSSAPTAASSQNHARGPLTAMASPETVR